MSIQIPPNFRARCAGLLTIAVVGLAAAPALADANVLDGVRPIHPDEPPRYRSESQIRSSLLPESVTYARGELKASKSEAEDWLVTQAQVVPQLNVLYREVGLNRLGLVRFDNDRRKLIVPTTDDAAEREVAAWARSSGINSRIVEHERLEVSTTEVQRRIETVSDAIERDGATAHARVDVDTRGRLVVTLSDTASETTSERVRRIAEDANAAIRRGTVDSPDAAFACWAHPTRTAGEGRRFCDMLTGGTAVDGLSNGSTTHPRHCTAGFFVASPVPFEPYLLTAGHCINIGVTAWSYTSILTRAPVGPTQNKMFGPGHGGDAGLVKITNTPFWGAYPGWMNWNPSPPAVPTQSAVAGYATFNVPKDTIVCKNGQAAGTACGTVTNALWDGAIGTDSGAVPVIHMLEIAGGCVIGGDSGSPVTMASMAVAVGITSASYCTEGGGPELWYAEPIHRALSTTGTLMLTPSGPI